MSELKIGDRVIFLIAPESLLHDLPENEQAEILSYVGQEAAITEVSEAGYFWIGFGTQTDDGDYSAYSGHSFSVTADCLRKVE